MELRPKRRQCLFEKTKVDFGILAPSVELRPKRRHCLLEKTKMDLNILGPMHKVLILHVGFSSGLNC